MAIVEEKERKRGRSQISVQSQVGSCSCSDQYSDDDDDEICSRELKKILHTVVAAEPLMRCAWSGDFDVRHDESIYHRRIYSLNAFVSSKACKKVHDACAALGEAVNLEMLPTNSVWPESFDQSESGGPTDEDISLYLFPPLPLHQKFHDNLVLEMIDCDLAMRAILPNGQGELLVFPSTELPVHSYRLQDNFYLWGVFTNPKPTSKNNL